MGGSKCQSIVTPISVFVGACCRSHTGTIQQVFHSAKYGRKHDNLTTAQLIFELMSGFISKFLLFYGTLQAGLSGDTWIIALVVAGVLNSALSLYYYFKVIRFMYLYDASASEGIEFSNTVRYISFLTLLSLAIIIPLFWQSLFEICERATVALMT